MAEAEGAGAVAAEIEGTTHIPASILLQWHITDRCNRACRHCYQHDRSEKNDLSYDVLLSILEQFRDLVQFFRRQSRSSRIPAHITITGGEPFLREDFLPLIEKFHSLKNEFSYAVLTNGSRIDDNMARQLKRLNPGFIQLSLDGGPAIHDALRGEGDHGRVLNTAKRLKRAGIAVMFSFTANRNNFTEFSAVADAGRRIGVKRVWADRFIPLEGATGEKELVMSPEETSAFLAIMASERKKRRVFGKTDISMHRALQFLEGGGRPYRCSAGNELITVLSDGTLTPCRRLPIPVGKLMETPLAVLYQASPLFRELRDERGVREGCEGCLYKWLCGGGLRCLSHAMTGSFLKADPGCRKAGHVSQFSPRQNRIPSLTPPFR